MKLGINERQKARTLLKFGSQSTINSIVNSNRYPTKKYMDNIITRVIYLKRMQNFEFTTRVKEEHIIIAIGYNAINWGLLRAFANC